MKSTEIALNLVDKLIFKEKKLFNKEEEKRYSATDSRFDNSFLLKPERSINKNDDWFITVPSFFNDCLDISKNNRIFKVNNEKKETRKVWTQGSRFFFHQGCILYDTPQAYQNWGIAIEKLKYCITINNGTSAEPAMYQNERFPGLVEFTILSPKYKSLELKEIGKFKLTQDDFVRFLIKGNPEIL